jgi:protein disulfide-isomerase
MKHFTIFTCAVLLFVGSTAFINDTSKEIEAELQWHEKLAEAQVISKKTNKPIFAFFTVSDWCGWCHRLQATVFAKPEFKQWANENVVLLELDFPRRKKLPADIAQQNNELKAFFKPRGYPTIWIFTMNMNEESKSYEISALGNLGYPSAPEGKEAATFIGNANKILAKTN